MNSLPLKLYPLQTMRAEVINDSALPLVVRIGNYGFVLSAIGLAIGGATAKILNAFVPGLKNNGIPAWLWPILILIWTPGAIGIVLSFYSIARYPYLSIATRGGHQYIGSTKWLWSLIGIIFYVLAFLFSLTALLGIANSAETSVMVVYLAFEFAFVGFLLRSFGGENGDRLIDC